MGPRVPRHLTWLFRLATGVWPESTNVPARPRRKHKPGPYKHNCIWALAFPNVATFGGQVGEGGAQAKFCLGGAGFCLRLGLVGACVPALSGQTPSTQTPSVRRRNVAGMQGREVVGRHVRP